MALIVADTASNFSTATWYRAEAWQLDMSGTPLILTTQRYSVTTFANAGNIKAIVPIIGAFAGATTVPSGRTFFVDLQKGRTATATVAASTVVTLTGHGFPSPVAGVTISIASPAVVTLAGHGLKDGWPVGFSTTGALPTGLSTSTQYFAKSCTANTFEVCTTRGGASVSTSGTQSGTHSLWSTTVQLTTTGALPSGITANSQYFADIIDANSFYLRSAPGSTRIGTTGTQSGVHTCWDIRDYASRADSEVFASGSTIAINGMFPVPFNFGKQAAIDTSASGWRFRFGSYSGAVGNPFIMVGPSSNPFFIAWSTTATSYTTSDTPIIAAPITIDQDVTFKGTAQVTPYGSAGNTISLAGFVCSPASTSRGYSTTGAGNGMLVVDTTAPRTITVDGAVLCGTQAGIYLGTEAVPATYANRIRVNFVAPTMAGATALMSAFGDLSFNFDYYGSGITICKSGEYPAIPYATLTADANTGQKDATVDDVTPFAVNDYVYISKHDAVYSGTLNATRYQIASIAGNTLTMTANITGKRLAGGRVVLVERGYGVQYYSESLTASSYGERCHAPVNYYARGVYNQGTQPVHFFGSIYRYFDLDANRRAGGMYVGNTLSENYQNAQASAARVIGSIIAEKEGILFENNLSIHGRLFNSLLKVILSLSATIYYKTGNAEVANNFNMRSPETSPLVSGSGSTSAAVNVHDNIIHNCNGGMTVGMTNSRYTANYIYGSTSGVNYAASTFFAALRNNIYDRCTTYTIYGGSGVVIIGATEDYPTFSNGTPIGYSMSLPIDTYIDLTVFAVKGDASGFDFTNQALMSDGSSIKLIRNNNTDGDIWDVQPVTISRDYTTALPIPTATLDTPEVITTSFNGTSIYFKTAGTYDLRSGTHVGTLTLNNDSAAAVTVKINPSVSVVNVGCTLDTKVLSTITAANIPLGASVRLINVTTNTELDLVVVTASTYSYTFTATAGDVVRLQAIKASGTTYSKYYEFTGVVSEFGGAMPVIAPWETWVEATAIGVDGSTVTDFILDPPNVEIDISDTSAPGFWMKEAIAFLLYKTATDAAALRTFFGALVSQNAARWVIDVTKVNLRFDNLQTTSAQQTDEVILTRSDGATLARIPTTGGGGIGIAIANDVASLIGTASDIADAVWNKTLP